MSTREAELALDRAADASIGAAPRIVSAQRGLRARRRRTPAAAMVVSVAVHVAAIVGVFIAGGPAPVDATPPVIDFAAGSAARVATIRMLTPEQLAELQGGKPLEQVAPVQITAPPPPRPPMPEPHRTARPAVVMEAPPARRPTPIDTSRSRADPLPEPKPRPVREPAAAPPVEPEPQPDTRPEPDVRPTPQPPQHVHADPPRERRRPEPFAEQTTAGTPGVDREPTVARLPRPEYPSASRRRGEQGLVVFDVRVNADGRATSMTLIEDPGHWRLVDSARRAIRAARFQPALRGGRPVAGLVRVPIRFVLRD